LEVPITENAAFIYALKDARALACQHGRRAKSAVDVLLLPRLG
jgi:hypothetical protein